MVLILYCAYGLVITHNNDCPLIVPLECTVSVKRLPNSHMISLGGKFYTDRYLHKKMNPNYTGFSGFDVLKIVKIGLQNRVILEKKRKYISLKRHIMHIRDYLARILYP